MGPYLASFTLTSQPLLTTRLAMHQLAAYVLHTLDPPSRLWTGTYYPHFTDEETEAQSIPLLTCAHPCRLHFGGVGEEVPLA